MENAGAIFLPNAGVNSGASYSRGPYECYQTSTNGAAETNYMVSCSGNGLSVNSSSKYKTNAVPVRLVRDVPQYSITTSATNGTVIGGGTYDAGTVIQLSATPAECYEFVQWSDGNTDNPRTVTVTEDATYTAEFGKIQYTVKGKDATGGHVEVEK